VKATATANTAQIIARHQHKGAKYSMVFDQRKRRVRGLWDVSIHARYLEFKRERRKKEKSQFIND
jgi:hypothetical protein